MTKITIDRATVEQALETLLDCEDQLVKPYNRKAYYAAEALHSALEQPNEFHPDWDQIKPFNDRIAELEKVAKQALEAIEEFVSNELTFGQRYTNEGQCLLDSIAALRQALEQDVSLINEGNKGAQQEPVAWMLEWTFNGEERGCRLYDDERRCIFDAGSDGGVCRPLYTHPQVIDKSAAIRIATALGWEPRREWVGLTDEEVDIVCEQIAADGPHHSIERFVNAIAAKLKEKNT